MSTISASPEALRMFFYNCNTDAEFRRAFLDHPIKTLIENDITVNKRAANEIMELLKKLRETFEKDIYLVPVGWEDHPWELSKDGWGLVIHTPKRGVIP